MNDKNLIFDGRESVLNYKSIIFWCVIGTLFTFGLGLIFIAPYLLFKTLSSKFTFYKISSEILMIEKGVLSKNIDNLELWRIKDIKFQQTIFQKIFSEATVILITQDSTTPIITISGVGYNEARRIFDELSVAIPAARKQNRVTAITA